jgi:hypothetical protein
MCCKLMGVAAVAKPPGQWCRHIVKGRGCGIYQTRPEECRAFRCRWLVDEQLGDEWKPDRCRFLLSLDGSGAGLWVHVDATAPTAWRREPYYSTIRRWAEAIRSNAGYVAVCIGARVLAMFPEEELEIGQVEPDARLKVGYRYDPGGVRRPLVIAPEPDGTTREILGGAYSNVTT